MNCNLSVSLFLHDIDFTTMSDVVRVLQGVTHVYTGMCMYTVTHPSEFGFVFTFEIKTHIFTSFVRIRIRIRNGAILSTGSEEYGCFFFLSL